jgi:hypothetical protein
MFQRFALALVVLFFCVLGGFARTAGPQAPTFYPSPIIEKFDIWGTLTHDQKIIFYTGWANGLFTTTKDSGTLALGSCLKEKLNWELIVAMVDKWNADHREEWQNPMSTEIIEAVTAAGSPCAGLKVGN